MNDLPWHAAPMSRAEGTIEIKRGGEEDEDSLLADPAEVFLSACFSQKLLILRFFVQVIFKTTASPALVDLRSYLDRKMVGVSWRKIEQSSKLSSHPLDLVAICCLDSDVQSAELCDGQQLRRRIALAGLESADSL